MSPSPSVSVLIRIDGCRDARFNMRTDRALLARAEASEFPFTCVRLYGWEGPTVSLGRNQDPATALDGNFCKRHAIDWVHRPTGGRAVYHDRELTYAVTSNDEGLFPVGQISETYRVIGEILQQGLRRVGLETTMEKRASGSSSTDGVPPACFVSTSRYELTWRGRKLVGSAQRVLRRSFLQHGSIPLSLDYRMAEGALRSKAGHLKALSTTLREALPQGLDAARLEVEMAREFWTGLLETRIQEAHVRTPMSP